MPSAPSRAGVWLTKILELPRPLLLAFDVDGTLAPIALEPSRARVPRAVIDALAKLAAAPEVHVAVITGRDPAALSVMLPLTDIYRAVLHGKLLLEPGEVTADLPLSAQETRALSEFEQFARRSLAPAGAVLEQKPGALGVHVRELEQRDAAAARTVLRTACERARALGLHARDGRALVEVESRPGDKGEALRRIHALCRARSVVCLGDDLTDLPALRYASEHGLGLFVRSSERSRCPPGLSGVLSRCEDVHELVMGLARRLS